MATRSKTSRRHDAQPDDHRRNDQRHQERHDVDDDEDLDRGRERAGTEAVCDVVIRIPGHRSLNVHERPTTPDGSSAEQTRRPRRRRVMLVGSSVLQPTYSAVSGAGSACPAVGARFGSGSANSAARDRHDRGDRQRHIQSPAHRRARRRLAPAASRRPRQSPSSATTPSRR